MRYLYLILILVFFCCKLQKQLDVQGHRGCRGLYPENSLPGFQNALELGVHTLEMDVVITKDSLVVLSHEPFMSHEIALDVNGNEISSAQERSFNLFQMTYDSIKRYDCGSKPHGRFPTQKKQKVHKPLLSEVIEMAETHSNQSIRYNIEIKSMPEYDGIHSPQVKTYVDLVIDIIASKAIEERTIIQSFDIRALEYTNKQYPFLQLALLVDENESITQKLSELTFEPEIVSPYFKLLDQEIVTILQSRGFKIIPWTINDLNDIRDIMALNVDGIISDYPNQVFEVLH